MIRPCSSDLAQDVTQLGQSGSAVHHARGVVGRVDQHNARLGVDPTGYGVEIEIEVGGGWNVYKTPPWLST